MSGKKINEITGDILHELYFNKVFVNHISSNRLYLLINALLCDKVMKLLCMLYDDHIMKEQEVTPKCNCNHATITDSIRYFYIFISVILSYK
uniref:Uncharacterized protein n=1 Tax=Anguilla anguilla TaxID=7936 RepID=A0A0E9WWP8_ANGAN